jgi:hypothetical protein
MQTIHRHAARMKAQRIAWDYSILGCLEGVDAVWVQTSLRDRLGRMSSISTNERPCNQQHLRFPSLKPSESRPSKDALACSRRRMTARCIDAQLDVPIMVYVPTPSGRLAQRSQRWSCSSREQISSTDTLRMMSACSWPKCSLLRSLSDDAQSSAAPETPGSSWVPW